MPETDTLAAGTQHWLNKSFLERALNSTEEDENIQVTSYEVSKATAAGDNYASEMYRVNVHYTRRGQAKTRSLIVKSEPTAKEMSQIMEEVEIFQRESEAISKLAPQLQSVLQKVFGDSENIQPFAAKCLYSQFRPQVIAIVLEDLKVQGFKMAERTKGLDMDHCSLVLRTLARYHAASLVLYKQNPDFFRNFDYSVYDEKTKNAMDGFFGQGVKNVVNEIEKWSEFDDRFKIKLQKISEIVVDYIIQTYKKQDGDFNVLVHGDLWLNNMMFRYCQSTGKVQDIRFVDYQVVTVTNAALDLQYFLHTSPSTELINKQSDLVEEYHKSLGETFTLLGHEHLHPTIEQLKKELDKKGLYGVIISCTLLPLVLVDRSDVPDMNKVLKKEEDIKFSKKFRETLHKLLPIFEEKGWLEVDTYFSR